MTKREAGTMPPPDPKRIVKELRVRAAAILDISYQLRDEAIELKTAADRLEAL